MSKQVHLLAITNTVAILGILLITSTQAKAELMTELYGGEGFTKNHNASVDLPDAKITGIHNSLKFNSAATIGGRAIYWINNLPYLGLGLDASHFFGPDQKNQISVTKLCISGFGCSTSPETIKKFNNNVTVLGLDIMLRLPLFVSNEFTKGRLQPYLSAGPAAFFTTLKDTNNFIPAGQSSTYTSFGVKAGAGFMLFLTKSLGTFIEYRGTNFKVKDQYNNATIVNDITLGRTIGNATFNMQAIVGGVSLCF